MENCNQICILKFVLVALSYTMIPSSQPLFNSSIKGRIYTLMFFPGYSGPGIINTKNMYFRCIIISRGRLSGITNTGQQLYGALVMPNGLNPSVAMATRTFRGSAVSPDTSDQNPSMLRHPTMCQHWPMILVVFVFLPQFVMRHSFARHIE